MVTHVFFLMNRECIRCILYIIQKGESFIIKMLSIMCNGASCGVSNGLKRDITQCELGLSPSTVYTQCAYYYRNMLII